MTTLPSVELAKHYVKLCNDADLVGIERLFTDTSTYRSPTSGVLVGVEPIMVMMRAFFARFERVTWDVLQLDETEPGVVRIDFVMRALTLAGEAIESAGNETLVVLDGKLRHVDVRR
ncbi:MAG: nuclear transport factor 2 family protein [Pseudomonadota bacterium]